MTGAAINIIDTRQGGDAPDDGGEMKASYKAVRERVALIDLSDEGCFVVSGPDAVNVLDRSFSMDLEIVPRWRGVSGLFLNEDASIIAIATVFRGDDECYVFTEADSAADLHKHLLAQLAGGSLDLHQLSESDSWLCIVGPNAQSVAAHVGGDDVLGMPYLSFEQNLALGLRIFRMGFCGEYEYRVLCPADRRHELIERLLDAGREFGMERACPSVLPLLMMEMRSLSSRDFPAGSDPIGLCMHWMVSFRKQAYPGADAVQALKLAPRSRALMLSFAQAGIAAAGDRLEIDGTEVGFCASVHYSPTLGKDVALACVNPDFGWVGVPFNAVGLRGTVAAVGVSAPLFVTRTVSAA